MRVGAGTPGLGARTRRVVTAAGIAKSAVTRRGFLSTAKPACVCKSSCKSSGHGSDRVDTTEVWDPRPIQLCASGLCGKQLRRGADRVLFRGIRAESDSTNRGKAAGFSDRISPRGRVWVKNSRPCRDLRFNLSRASRIASSLSALRRCLSWGSRYWASVRNLFGLSTRQLASPPVVVFYLQFYPCDRALRRRQNRRHEHAKPFTHQHHVCCYHDLHRRADRQGERPFA